MLKIARLFKKRIDWKTLTFDVGYSITFQVKMC